MIKRTIKTTYEEFDEDGKLIKRTETVETTETDPNDFPVLTWSNPVTCVPYKENTATWEFWSGWTGNHDQRIEDAKCSNCGYNHPTVYGSPKMLSTHCASCGAFMIIK